MNILVRGVPQKYKSRIQRIAQSKNLSVNQVVVQYVIRGIENERERENGDSRQQEAIRRLREIREEIYKKYGLSTDSTQIIREARDSRNKDL